MVKTAYLIGRRDMVADILMEVRKENGDCKTVLLRLAKEMLKDDPEHPHSKWFEQNLKSKK